MKALDTSFGKRNTGRSQVVAPRNALSAMVSCVEGNGSPSECDTGGCEMSFETYFVAKFDLYGWQRRFPERAAAYFRASGMTAPQIAVAFGVTERTAMNWLEGYAVPRGAQIALVAVRDPEGFWRHFGQEAA